MICKIKKCKRRNIKDSIFCKIHLEDSMNNLKYKGCNNNRVRPCVYCKHRFNLQRNKKSLDIYLDKHDCCYSPGCNKIAYEDGLCVYHKCILCANSAMCGRRRQDYCGRNYKSKYCTAHACRNCLEKADFDNCCNKCACSIKDCNTVRYYYCGRNYQYCTGHICKGIGCYTKSERFIYCEKCVCEYCGERKKKNKLICILCACMYKKNCPPCTNPARHDYSNLQLIHQLTNIPDDVIKYLIIPMTGSRKGHCQKHS